MWFLCVWMRDNRGQFQIVWGGAKPCEQVVNALLTQSFCRLTLIISTLCLFVSAKAAHVENNVSVTESYRRSRPCLKERHEWFWQNKTLFSTDKQVICAEPTVHWFSGVEWVLVQSECSAVSHNVWNHYYSMPIVCVFSCRIYKMKAACFKRCYLIWIMSYFLFPSSFPVHIFPLN